MVDLLKPLERAVADLMPQPRPLTGSVEEQRRELALRRQEMHQRLLSLYSDFDELPKNLYGFPTVDAIITRKRMLLGDWFDYPDGLIRSDSQRQVEVFVLKVTVSVKKRNICFLASTESRSLHDFSALAILHDELAVIRDRLVKKQDDQYFETVLSLKRRFDDPQRHLDIRNDIVKYSQDERLISAILAAHDLDLRIAMKRDFHRYTSLLTFYSNEHMFYYYVRDPLTNGGQISIDLLSPRVEDIEYLEHTVKTISKHL